MPEMRLAGPRYKYPVSNAELDRRLAAVQSALRAAGLDGCILQTTSTIFDSVVRYLIDRPTHGYGNTVLVPASGAMTLINHGLDFDNADVPPSMRNVEKLITKPYCQPFYCTDGITGDVVARELQTRGWKRVGLTFPQLASADLVGTLKEKLPALEIVDFSAQFSRIKAVKSAEEWALVDRCIRAHEQLIDCVPSLLRPGRMEYEVLADLEHASRYMGCDYIGNIAVGSAKSGGNTVFCQNFAAGRRIEMGDSVTVMIEVAGPGGIYGELARTFCLGEPNASLLKLYDEALACQKAIADAAKPGVTGKQLNDVFNAALASYGLPENGRFGGHSQGYDMMEAPAICPTEEMALEEDMFFAIHPELFRDGEFSIACDNFRITKSGAERVTRTEQKIFALEF